MPESRQNCASRGMECRSCRWWWYPFGDPIEWSPGRCRQRSPVAFFDQTEPDKGVQTAFPPMAANEGCGDWEAVPCEHDWADTPGGHKACRKCLADYGDVYAARPHDWQEISAANGAPPTRIWQCKWCLATTRDPQATPGGCPVDPPD